MQVRVRRLGRHRIAASAVAGVVAAGLVLTGCGSGIPDEPVRTGELQPTPTALPTATPVPTAEEG